LRRTVFLVMRGQDWSQLADTLARGGITRFTVLARTPRPDLPIAPFTRLSAWEEPRYWVARYAR
jgi:hypothetical protein